MKLAPEITNIERAAWANRAIKAFVRAAGGMPHEDNKTKVADLMANLMHFCYINNVDFESALRMSTGNFKAEVGGDP